MTSYPPFALDHLLRMTDDTGIIQHALFAVPDPVHGYSVDDQARALMVSVAYARLAGDLRSPRCAFTYLSFLGFSANQDGSFHNFLSFDRRWLDDRGSGDSQGRVWWALAQSARHGRESGFAAAAAKLFENSIAAAYRLQSPRSWANTVFGLYHRLHTVESADQLALLHELAGRLVSRYEEVSGPEWGWFEPQ
ncbi:MAG: glycosyl transferase family 1, partial [Chloroflexota bacterium]